MAIRGFSLIPSTVTKTLICVDRIDGVEFSGRLFNPYMKHEVAFSDIARLIGVMDSFFSSINYPQAFFEDRLFIEKKRDAETNISAEREVQLYMSEDIFDTEQGKKATFVVQVQFRQNATWQGIITWNEEKKTRRFRSTLEMIRLMDNALIDANPDDKGSGWK